MNEKEDSAPRSGGPPAEESTADMTDYHGKKTAMEIAFGRIQGIVEELKDDPALKEKMMQSH
jgi:hypothetical protein